MRATEASDFNDVRNEGQMQLTHPKMKRETKRDVGGVLKGFAAKLESKVALNSDRFVIYAQVERIYYVLGSRPLHPQPLVRIANRACILARFFLFQIC